MCDEKLLYFDSNTLAYGQPAKINIDERCNAITAKNAGTTILIFDGEQLVPGESKTIGGNRMEILTGRHEIAFQTQVPPPVTIVNLAFITQKFYVDPPYKPK